MLGCPAGGDSLVNDGTALLSQSDEDTAPILRIGHASDQPSAFEPINPIGHGP
jgi:hypothetical protein